MTVEIELIPDNNSKMPREVMDDEIVATYLEKLNVPEQTPIDSWKDITRITYHDGSKIVLRIEGITMSDIPDKLLERSYKAITSQASGVKPHPNGWHNVETNILQ